MLWLLLDHRLITGRALLALCTRPGAGNRRSVDMGCYPATIVRLHVPGSSYVFLRFSLVANHTRVKRHWYTKGRGNPRSSTIPANILLFAPG